MNAGSRRTNVLSHFGQLSPGSARNRFAARRRACSGANRITRFIGRAPLYTGNAVSVARARAALPESLPARRRPERAVDHGGRMPDIGSFPSRDDWQTQRPAELGMTLVAQHGTPAVPERARLVLCGAGSNLVFIDPEHDLVAV